jgi:hypothetical protein
METAVATPARTAEVAAPFPLVEVEDLHDADLDGVLADRLLEATVAGLVCPAAVEAHALGARALLLAVL